EVVTPNESAKAVRQTILTALQGKLNIREQARFDMVDSSLPDAMNKAVFPIDARTTTIAGQAPDALRTHVGGVAIVLKDLNPRLDVKEIKTRIDQQRLSQAGSAGRISQFSVEGSSDGSLVIVMTSDPELTYDASDPARLAQWTDELATPAWNIVREAINKP